MQPVRFGILSTSSIAPRFIAALREARAGQVLALSSRSLEKARQKAALWEIPRYYGSHRQLLEDPDVDIVYISTVNSQHYPWAKAALEMGKHVLCEKPCTTTQAQTQALYALAGEKGRFFMEAEKMLFLPAILEARRIIESGQLGQIHMAQLSHSFPGSYNGWMFDPEAGGGPLLSSGIYAVHLMDWLFGPIDTIQGQRSTLPNGVEWQYILTGSTRSGVLFSAQNSTQAILDNTCRIFGSQGWLEIPEYWKARKVILQLSGQPQQILEFPCQHELIYEVIHVLSCLEQGLTESPVVTGAFSARGIAALETVKRSWKEAGSTI